MNVLGALGVGALIPLFCILFGRVSDKLNGGGSIQDEVNKIVILFVVVAAGNILVGYLQVVGWSVAGERISRRIRIKFVRTILSQDIGWYVCQYLV